MQDFHRRAAKSRNPAWPTFLFYIAMAAHVNSSHALQSACAAPVMFDAPLRKRAVPPAISKPGDWIRVPPAGWRWASIAVDSGCNIHIVNDRAVFDKLNGSDAQVRVADGRATRVAAEGPVALQTYNTEHQPVSLVLSRALYAPKMKNLLSVTQLLRQGCDVVMRHDGFHYIKTPQHGILRLRSEGEPGRELVYLDYLVPRNNNVSALCPLPHDDFHRAYSASGMQ